MHADEHHLETTHEIPRHQQLEAAVLEGLAQRLHDGLFAFGRHAPYKTRFTQKQRQRHDQQHRSAQEQQRFLPAERADEPAFDRHHQELAERAGRGGDAHGPGAFLGRYLPPDHAVDHGVGGAGLGRTDQHARG
ncbi:hypothetical protein D9M69_680800 [compost metagenome]